MLSTMSRCAAVRFTQFLFKSDAMVVIKSCQCGGGNSFAGSVYAAKLFLRMSVA
jgi:hypothetical protein